MKQQVWIVGLKKACVIALIVMAISAGCSTIYVEFRGECVMQQWQLFGQAIRNRTLCDLPPPELYETQVRDREPMDTNPFPDLIDLDNEADSVDPNLLEKQMGIPQVDDNE